MTIYKTAAKLLVWCVPALSLIACSDSDGGTGGGAGTGGAAAGGGAGTGGAATGGGGAGPSTSGVQGSKRLDGLTNSEKMMICDFAAAKTGGYGKSVDCGDGSTIDSNYANQAECVADAPTNCAMTVSQYEQCVREQSCADLLPASCAPVLQCS